MMDPVIVGSDKNLLQGSEGHPDVRVDPDVHHHPQGERHSCLPWSKFQEGVGDYCLRNSEEEEMRHAGPRPRKPPELLYRMVEGVSVPKERAMHGPVDPVKTEVGKDNSYEYLQHAREIEDTGKGMDSPQFEYIQAAPKEDFRCFPHNDHDEQGENVQGQLSSPVHNVSGAATLQEVNEQNNNNEGDGLIELLSSSHCRSMAQNRFQCIS